MAPRRLLLFDIDGTLVRAGPIGGAVFNRAIEAVLGEVPNGRVRMSGKTDPQIVREYLALMHSDDPSHLPAVLEHLQRELADAADQLAIDGTACPGEACRRHGAAPGILASTVAVAQEWRRKGVRCLCYGVDIGVFQTALSMALQTRRSDSPSVQTVA